MIERIGAMDMSLSPEPPDAQAVEQMPKLLLPFKGKVVSKAAQTWEIPAGLFNSQLAWVSSDQVSQSFFGLVCSLVER